MTVGEKIQREAALKGYNIRQLALSAEVNYSTLYAIIKRKSKNVDPTILERIAEVLDVTPEYFLDSVEHRIELTDAELVVLETISGICGIKEGKEREDMLYLINDFLEANHKFLTNIYNVLLEKKKEKKNV